MGTERGGGVALNNKQQLFVESYLQCFNRTRAAADAGYSEKTAYSIGAELLKKPEIQEAISQRLSESAMSADEVLMRLAEQARGEHSKYIVADGTVNIGKLVEDNKAHLIKEVEEAKDGTKKYKFYDAQGALNTLAKHHGLLVDKVDATFSNLDIDYSKLTTPQLERIAKGESILKVIIDGYISDRKSEG